MESDRTRWLTRGGFLITAGGVAGAGAVAHVVGRGVTYPASRQKAPVSAGGGPAGLNAFAANVLPGGPGKDGIRAIDRFGMAGRAHRVSVMCTSRCQGGCLTGPWWTLVTRRSS
jgi:hypothetical protein